MDGRSLAHALAALIREHSQSPESLRWFKRALGLQPKQHSKWLGCFAGAGRKMGGTVVEFDLGETPGSDHPRASLCVRWPLHELARVSLLLTFVRQLDDEAAHSLVDDLFLRGDLNEQRATLRTLAYCPSPEMYQELAVEACRTNVASVFEGLAHDNPYPARWFSDEQFEQLVLKALFIGVSLPPILGLQERATPPLFDKVASYESERRAAGRPVPGDLAYLRSLHPSTLD